MNIIMQNIERLTLDQIREFVEGSRTIGFTAPMREAVYEFIERVLKSQQYRRLSRGQKGIVRRFLVKMTGLSRAQLTRWIGRWMKTRRVQRKPVCRPSFPRRYTAADIALLAGVDAAHEDLSGPAVRRVVKREHEVFAKPEYERLAGISVSHIYNLRNSTVCPLPSDENPIRAAGLAIFGQTQCTRATTTAKPGCTTSMPSTQSPNGR